MQADIGSDSSGSASSDNDHQTNRHYDDSMEDDSSTDEVNKITNDECINPIKERKYASTDDSEKDDEDEEAEEEAEESVVQDMVHFAQTFKGIESQYRLINRIGEGMTWIPITCIRKI